MNLSGHRHCSCFSDVQWIEKDCLTLCFSVFKSFAKFKIFNGLRIPLGHPVTESTNISVTEPFSMSLMMLWAHEPCLFASWLLIRKRNPFCLCMSQGQTQPCSCDHHSLTICECLTHQWVLIPIGELKSLQPHYSFPVNRCLYLCSCSHYQGWFMQLWINITF